MELCGEVWVRRQSKDAEEVERPSVLATPPATPVPVKEKPLKTHAEGGPVKEKPLKAHSEAESGASAGPSTNPVLSPADVGFHAADNSIPPQMMNIYPQQEGNVSLCSTLPTHGSQPPKHKLLCGFQVASHSDNKSSAEKTLSTSTSRPHNEAMSSPFAPVTPDKGNGSQDCRFQEVIKLVGQWEKMENMGKPGTLQPVQKELIHSSSKSDATPERASRHHDVEPHAAEPSERNSVQALDSKKKYKRSGKGLGLNKTPRQILKRKRHRPKVIQEGKTTKIPKLSIPKPAGKTKRSNVRKNRAKQNGADTPTSLEGKDADPHNASTPNKEIDLHSKSGHKSVRRSLNFDLEGHPASEVSNVEPQVQETCRGTSTSFGTASTVQLAEGLELVVENTYAGIAFDLNRSLNQMLDDYIKLPEYPALPTQSHRRITKRENLKDLARRKGRMDGIVMEADNSLPPIYQNEEKHVDSNGKQDVLEEENLQNSTLRGHEHRTNSCSLYFPQVHKKRRTEKGRNERTPDNPVTSPHSKVFTFTHAQTLMALERPHTEHVYSLDRIEITTKKRSKVPIQARNPSSLAAIISCGMPTYENLCENTNAEGSKLHGPHACMQALFADALVKMKTKNRTKKRPIHLLSSIYSNAKQEHGVLSRSYRYFLGKESIQDCQSSSSFQGSISGPLSGEVVAYVDPVDDIVQRLRYLHIDTHQKGITFHEENNLIPYVGGGLIIPYEDALDTAKKRRPRAKVDLDRETHKVWKLLMGKAALDACEGSDMDKEKWWEDERAVFRGRVDSFIARMRLVQGDRCFSQWKGSVVDSVVGVFLTQNVSDHLSSSAFMALAAKFPLRSKGDNEESDAGKVNGAKEDNDGCFQTYNDSIKWQERMSGLEKPYQGSRLNHDAKVIEKSELANSKKVFAKNTAWVRADYSKGASVDVHGGEGKKGHEIQEKQRNTLYTVATVSTESVNRSLPDIVLSQISVSSENSSDCLIETANQVSSSSDSNSEAEDLTVGSKCSSFDSTSYMELLQIEETTKILESRSNDSGRSFPKGKGGTNDQHTYMISGPLLEKSTEGAGILTLKTECAVGLQSISHHSVQQLICSEKEICIEKNSFCQNNLIREITEALPGQDLSHSQLQEEHTAKLQQNDSKADFQAENSKDEAEVQVQSECYTRQEACSDSSNTLTENLEVVKADESNLNDVICSPTKDPTKTASRAKTLKSKSESRKNFDWDSLRRQACLIGAKKERSNDRMDSLDWEAVRHADVNELSQTIRERGMNNVLAERIKELLDRLVRDHGSIDLEWLRDIPPDKAKDYLLSIRGLGPKSVECVRLLTLHHLAFPVDTNVGRICVRLGWVPLQPLPEFLQLHLLELYPVLETIQKYLWPRLCTLDQRTLYELHYQMITFGKVFCTKSKPNCNACPMRGECKHFASAFASARLALPGPEEKSLVISMIPNSSGHNMFFKSMPIPQLKGSQASQERSISGHDSVFKPMAIPELEGSELSQEGTVGTNCEPIIEEPATPEPECIETVDSAIENAFYEDPDEIPKIELNMEEFTQNLQNYMQTSKVEPKECDWSNALVALTPEAASIPIPKLKNVSRLRTEHQVYELPDLHPLLEGMDQREPDDPCPYLLAIWTPGETAQSTEPPKTCCDTQVTGKLCDKKVCFACNSAREAQAQTVRGTLLIPCRTAMRGSFPLNGTYFQVNEVFADHDSSCNPIDVPRKWIWNLPRRIVFFGTSIPTIFRGLTTEGIQQCFWRGFVCVRGFDKTTRAPRPLYARLHCPASKAPRNKKTPEEEALLRRSARKT